MEERLWAENNKDSKGATFSFSLPVKVANFPFMVRDGELETNQKLRYRNGLI